MVSTSDDCKYIVKVADFGLSKALESSEYYKMENSTQFAVKWASPEALRYGKFAKPTDVWAFGVTMWYVIELA